MGFFWWDCELIQSTHRTNHTPPKQNLVAITVIATVTVTVTAMDTVTVAMTVIAMVMVMVTVIHLLEMMDDEERRNGNEIGIGMMERVMSRRIQRRVRMMGMGIGNRESFFLVVFISFLVFVQTGPGGGLEGVARVGNLGRCV